MAEAPLKLHWWAQKPNFGDALSQLVTAHASGREVVHAQPAKAEIYAVGSILQIARRVWGKKDRPAHRPAIWGTGMLGPIQTAFTENVDIHMVRGPITASLLGLKTESYGDPGLLTAEALGDVPERHDKIGLVLHHGQLGHPAVKALIAAEPERIEYIDVQGTPEEVCPKIGACAHVISSSLHGLIVADSYGVANTWLDPLKQPRMKYYDYAAGIGRSLPLPVKHDDLAAVLPTLGDAELPYAGGISEAKDRLIKDFPSALRAGS